MTEINLEGYDNEDNDFGFTLQVGTVGASTPYDLTAVQFEADIRLVGSEGRESADRSPQQPFDLLILRMTTFEEDGRIQITDPVNGVFNFHIPLGQIAASGRNVWRYDLIMHANGSSRRLWGGRMRIKSGLTATVESP